MMIFSKIKYITIQFFFYKENKIKCSKNEKTKKEF